MKMKTMQARTETERIELLKQALTPERVCFLQDRTKDAALRTLIDLLGDCPCVHDKAELAEAVFKREGLMSTGIGLGLGVPHVRLRSVTDIVMAAGISRDGIADYASLDDKPVKLIFLIAAPEGQHVAYLRLLSILSARAKAQGDALLASPDAETFFNTLTGQDAPATRSDT